MSGTEPYLNTRSHSTAQREHDQRQQEQLAEETSSVSSFDSFNSSIPPPNQELWLLDPQQSGQQIVPHVHHLGTIFDRLAQEPTPPPELTARHHANRVKQARKNIRFEPGGTDQERAALTDIMEGRRPAPEDPRARHVPELQNLWPELYDIKSAAKSRTAHGSNAPSSSNPDINVTGLSISAGKGQNRQVKRPGVHNADTNADQRTGKKQKVASIPTRRSTRIRLPIKRFGSVDDTDDGPSK